MSEKPIVGSITFAPDYQDKDKFAEFAKKFEGNYTKMAKSIAVDKTTISKWGVKHGYLASDFRPVIKTDFKALCIDIETSPNLAHVWELWQQNVSLNQLMESGRMICFAAKWLGKKKVIFRSEFHDDKASMLSTAYDLMSEADAIIHYHGNGFDIPTLNREFLLNGMTPPKPSKQIDLYRISKKNFKLPSYKLDYLAQVLGVGSKVKHEGHELWVKCLLGDEKAWRTMKKYNIKDTCLLEDVYYRLLPWVTNHPNLALYDDRAECPNCGGRDFDDGGEAKTSVASYRQMKCTKCGTWVREKKCIGRTDLQQTKF